MNMMIEQQVYMLIGKCVASHPGPYRQTRGMPHACIVVARTGVARTAAALTITSMHDSHHVLEFLRRKEWW